MSRQWRILVVDDDEHLNRNIVNALQKDGYTVYGIPTGAEAIRVLWAEAYDVVITSHKLPDADGMALLQWIGTYCPNTRLAMLAAAGLPGTRTQALENGVVSYLEKPVDLHFLRGELRRILQQTGFSASLDSFDLLDVVQIINMSGKTIALVVNTGLEEQGVLRFEAGELTWAEYGTLRGEEAFFALAAHKTGTVTHQPWNDHIVPNVTQPLSRLILQALQYRAKYAVRQQLSGEQIAITPPPPPLEIDEGILQSSQDRSQLGPPLLADARDDRPFVFVAEQESLQVSLQGQGEVASPPDRRSSSNEATETKEWWQESGSQPRMNKSAGVRAQAGVIPPANDARTSEHRRSANEAGASTAPPPGKGSGGNAPTITPSTVRKTPAGQRADLPAWLTEQPTQFEVQAMRPSSLTGTAKVPAVPGQGSRSSSAEWQPVPAPAEPANPATPAQPSLDEVLQHTSAVSLPRYGSPEWQPPQNVSAPESPAVDSHGTASFLQSLATPRKTDDLRFHKDRQASGPLPAFGATGPSKSSAWPAGDAVEVNGKQPAPPPEPARPGATSQHTAKRNYPALVAALQTLGYSLPGFVAVAIVQLDGQPVAQVAVDDLDISPLCGYLRNVLQAALFSLDHGRWGRHEHTVISSATHHILLRLLGSERAMFQVLITTRESDPVASLEIMANVEGAIIAAL